MILPLMAWRTQCLGNENIISSIVDHRKTHGYHRFGVAACENTEILGLHRYTWKFAHCELLKSPCIYCAIDQDTPGQFFFP